MERALNLGSLALQASALTIRPWLLGHSFDLHFASTENTFPTNKLDQCCHLSQNILQKRNSASNGSATDDTTDDLSRATNSKNKQKNSDQIEQDKKTNSNYMIKATHDATRVILFAKISTRVKKKSTDDKNSDF